jgi:hypothetical protein
MVEEDIYKIAFWCPFVGLFEWVVMTFGLKNAGGNLPKGHEYDNIGGIHR